MTSNIVIASDHLISIHQKYGVLHSWQNNKRCVNLCLELIYVLHITWCAPQQIPQTRHKHNVMIVCYKMVIKIIYKANYGYSCECAFLSLAYWQTKQFQQIITCNRKFFTQSHIVAHADAQLKGKGKNFVISSRYS